MLWYLVFLLLALEVLLAFTFCIPLLGFTSQLSRSLTYFWQNSSKLRTFTYVIMGVVFLLFIDSAYRVKRMSGGDQLMPGGGGGGGGVERKGPRDPLMAMSLMFRSQRNAYISGFCLVLFVVLHRLQANAQLLYQYKKENKNLRKQAGFPLSGPLPSSAQKQESNVSSSSSSSGSKDVKETSSSSVSSSSSSNKASAPPLKDLKAKKND